jgi:hypothetical protein
MAHPRQHTSACYGLIGGRPEPTLPQSITTGTNSTGRPDPASG